MSDSGVVVIGGGPAGLMAAEVACLAGCPVHLYDHMGSVGRKILIAGKGGLNLTHSEPAADFLGRYRHARERVAHWLGAFDPEALKNWAAELGVETVVGSSGRVFPADFKAAPLLRGWVRRLREQGVVFHMNHRWLGWGGAGLLRFQCAAAEIEVPAAATVLALGGGSWARLGSDGRWIGMLAGRGIDVAPLTPSNCGFEVVWSDVFRQRFAGQPLKSVALALGTGSEHTEYERGEFLLTDYGVEGSLIYALSAPLREALQEQGKVNLCLDLFPERSVDSLVQKLGQARGKRSFSEYLRRSLGLEGVRTAMVRELCPNASVLESAALAARLKALPLKLGAARPIDEAISTAGGVRLKELDDKLMLNKLPGVFCAGEMLDWDAPTGGYLLTACFASGKVAGLGAAEWLGKAGFRFKV